MRIKPAQLGLGVDYRINHLILDVKPKNIFPSDHFVLLVGRKLLDEIGTLFTPDTILRWHRELVAQKWDHSANLRTVGRPPTTK